MVRPLVLLFLPLLAIFLESTLFGHFSIWGTGPNVVLLVVAFYAIWTGSRAGFGYGFLCGLLEDLYTGRFIGMNAISKALTACVLGRLEVNVFKENVLVGFGASCVASLLNAVIMIVILSFVQETVVLDLAFFRSLGAQLVYNGLLSIPFYLWYYRASEDGVLMVPKSER
ncbi:MAG: rod shape-determining protein MreD [Solirubrobacterales bacterium]